MTKEELIKVSWGGAYGGDMCQNGWKPINSVFISTTLNVDYSLCGKLVRPKSLQGIETNNGWTKLIDENTWPTDRDILYDVCRFHLEEDDPSESLYVDRRVTAIEVIHMFNSGSITHYRKHVEELKPKY